MQVVLQKIYKNWCFSIAPFSTPIKLWWWWKGGLTRKRIRFVSLLLFRLNVHAFILGKNVFWSFYNFFWSLHRFCPADMQCNFRANLVGVAMLSLKEIGRNKKDLQKLIVANSICYNWQQKKYIVALCRAYFHLK